MNLKNFHRLLFVRSQQATLDQGKNFKFILNLKTWPILYASFKEYLIYSFFHQV